MPAPRRPRYASDPPALSPQTSLSLPSESDDGRVRSAEVKDGHLLPALDASYGRGSNELEHPLVEAYRSECSGKDSQHSPLRDAYVAASPPRNERLGPALIMKSMASPEMPRPQFSPKIGRRSGSSHACYGARSGGSPPRNLIMKSRRAPAQLSRAVPWTCACSRAATRRRPVRSGASRRRRR